MFFADCANYAANRNIVRYMYNKSISILSIGYLPKYYLMNQKQLLSFAQSFIFNFRFYVDICRTNYFSCILYFLNSVSAPASNSGNCKNRCKKFFSQIQHSVNHSRIKVYICTYTFIHLSFFSNYFRS